MFNAIISGLLGLLATVLQVIVSPINLVITNALPDLSDKIVETSNVISGVFDSITWALGLIPPQVQAILLFIISVEIAKHTIYISTHTLLSVWNVFQKIKFW